MRTIIKNIETRIFFSNEQVIEILKAHANLPEEVNAAIYLDDDTLYSDLELRCWQKITEEHND